MPKIRRLRFLVFYAVIGTAFFPVSVNAATFMTSQLQVVVIGDSLSYQMCGGDQQSIPTREISVMDSGCWGYPGATSGGLVRRIKDPTWVDPANVSTPNNRFNVRDALSKADVVVVSMGTNNALRQEPVQYLRWDVGNIRGMLKSSTRLYFIDLGVRTDVPAPLFNGPKFASAVAQNTALWDEARKYPNTFVLSWGGVTGPRPDALVGDGVHLSTPVGWELRWGLVRDTVR